MLSGFQHQQAGKNSIHSTGLLRTPGAAGSYTGAPGHIPEGAAGQPWMLTTCVTPALSLYLLVPHWFL